MIFAGKSKEEAMSDYITKVKQLLEEAAAAGTS
jgi:diazepam-binding inhibitor (GABA receptor modulating acyl-CoA-binding protein)